MPAPLKHVRFTNVHQPANLQNFWSWTGYCLHVGTMLDTEPDAQKWKETLKCAWLALLMRYFVCDSRFAGFFCWDWGAPAGDNRFHCRLHGYSFPCCDWYPSFPQKRTSKAEPGNPSLLKKPISGRLCRRSSRPCIARLRLRFRFRSWQFRRGLAFCVSLPYFFWSRIRTQAFCILNGLVCDSPFMDTAKSVFPCNFC